MRGQPPPPCRSIVLSCSLRDVLPDRDHRLSEGRRSPLPERHNAFAICRSVVMLSILCGRNPLSDDFRQIAVSRGGDWPCRALLREPLSRGLHDMLIRHVAIARVAVMRPPCPVYIDGPEITKFSVDVCVRKCRRIPCLQRRNSAAHPSPADAERDLGCTRPTIHCQTCLAGCPVCDSHFPIPLAARCVTSISRPRQRPFTPCRHGTSTQTDHWRDCEIACRPQRNPAFFIPSSIWSAPPVCRIDWRTSGRQRDGHKRATMARSPSASSLSVQFRITAASTGCVVICVLRPGFGKGRGRKHRQPRYTGEESSMPCRALWLRGHWLGQSGAHPPTMAKPPRLDPPTPKWPHGWYSCPHRSD